MKKNNVKKLVVGITAPLSVVLLKGQLRFFVNKGYQVYLLAPDSDVTREFCDQEGAKLLPVKIEREISFIKDLVSLFVIFNHLRAVKPDIVNVGTPKMGLLGMIASFLLGVPTRYYTCRGFRYEHETSLKRRILILMEKVTSYSAHSVICISDSIKDMGVVDGIFPINKTIVIGNGSSNGVDLELFSMEAATIKNKAKLLDYDNWKEKLVIGFVGRIVDRKGVNELYSAFCKLQLEYNNIHLIIVGKANLSQVSDPLLIEKMNNNKGVTLTGYVNNVNEYMSVMDIFVMPAWWEGFGNTLIQAAAMGLPIVSCDATGCRDAVKNGFNGVLVKPKSEQELTRAMRDFIEDIELRKEIGNNGLEWSKRFDSNQIWEGLNKVYLC